MILSELPNEIVYNILHITAQLNEQSGVQFTYGLTQPPSEPGYQKPPNRYVRGAVPPSLMKMDATFAIRSVCSKWHQWGLEYALHDLYVRSWRGSERWFELTMQRRLYSLYEMIEIFKGEKVYRDPWSSLRQTRDLVCQLPGAAAPIRRLWFDGLYVPETNAMILQTIFSCTNLQSVSVPWTILRQSSATDLAALLATNTKQPLRSLELLSVDLSKKQLELASGLADTQPLASFKVNFSQLKRLKLFGDTHFLPIIDDDLIAIARTATGLEEFQVTCTSSITIVGVMSIVKASQQTLRVLEHSPRSESGFFHPHPGFVNDQHLCEVLTQCPKLEDLSISLPSMCTALFSNSNVRWRGDCQVRALHLCGHEPHQVKRSRPNITRITSHKDTSTTGELKSLLKAARGLCKQKAASVVPTTLTIELFFADRIFDPHIETVHGDFELAEMTANGLWPLEKALSRKGPYGSTGLYGKSEEETTFERVSEREFLRGLDAGYLCI